MKKYTLVNQFTERYETKGRRRVRSREGQNFVVENFVLKKKREYEREKDERTPVRGIEASALVHM
jgi:hypothetical protein